MSEESYEQRHSRLWAGREQMLTVEVTQRRPERPLTWWFGVQLFKLALRLMDMQWRRHAYDAYGQHGASEFRAPTGR